MASEFTWYKILYAYNPQGFDQDQNTFGWSLDTAPAGMSINATTGSIRWTPTISQAGLQNVVLRLTDSTGLSVVQRYGIVVTYSAAPPRITSTPSTTGNLNQNYAYVVGATKTTNAPLNYSNRLTSPCRM